MGNPTCPECGGLLLTEFRHYDYDIVHALVRAWSCKKCRVWWKKSAKPMKGHGLKMGKRMRVI